MEFWNVLLRPEIKQGDVRLCQPFDFTDVKMATQRP